MAQQAALTPVTEVRRITRELFMEHAKPAAGVTTPVRMFTSPSVGYATASKVIVGNQSTAAVFSIWIGKRNEVEDATTLVIKSAALGGSGLSSSYIEFLAGTVYVNGGWISVASDTGNVGFQIHGNKVTIT